MDLLKAEISRKRKLSDSVEKADDGAVKSQTKALRQDAILSIEQQGLLGQRSNTHTEQETDSDGVMKTVPNSEAALSKPQIDEGGRPRDEAGKGSERQQCSIKVAEYSVQEIQEKLRGLGEAVMLFGEKDSEKEKRLVAALMSRSAGKEYDSKQNRAKEDRNGHENGAKKRRDREKARQVDSKDKDEEEEDVGVCTQYSDDLERMGPEKVIYKYFKNLVNQWESDLSQRNASELNSARGRADSNSFQNAKESIKALFKLCKKKEVPEDIRNQLLEMVKWCEAGNFRQAHDHYLQAAIGKAAWPIGVTSVGIHQRSNRERLSEAKIAHVMNNEMQRKYFTAVKRLMTYAQTRRPDILPSMKVL